MSECVSCGRCLPACPIYRLTLDEKLSPRGRLRIIRARAQGRLKNDRVLARVLSTCLLCGACERVCQNEVPVRSRVLAARAQTSGTLGPLLLKALASPRRLNRAARSGRRLLRTLEKTLGHGAGGDGAPLVLAGLALPRPAPRSLAEEIPAPLGPESGARILFFPGCLTDQLLPEAGRAAVDFLAWAGFRVWLPPGLGCCGFPALAAGRPGQAEAGLERLAETFVSATRKFGPAAALTGPCATCLRRLRLDLPRLWPETPPVLDLAVLADRAIEGARPTGDGREGAGLIATLHDPCHSLDPGSEAPEAARRVLAGLPGLTFKESNAEKTCCGLGGLFALSQPGLSGRMGEEKGRRIRAAGAEVAVTTCPACLIRLRDLGPRHGFQARHLAEVLAERLCPKQP